MMSPRAHCFKFVTFRECVIYGAPKCIDANMQCTWHIYADASYDDRRCGLGGVIASMAGDKIGYFSKKAPTSC